MLPNYLFEARSNRIRDHCWGNSCALYKLKCSIHCILFFSLHKMSKLCIKSHLLLAKANKIYSSYFSPKSLFTSLFYILFFSKSSEQKKSKQVYHVREKHKSYKRMTDWSEWRKKKKKKVTHVPWWWWRYICLTIQVQDTVYINQT